MEATWDPYLEEQYGRWTPEAAEEQQATKNLEVAEEGHQKRQAAEEKHVWTVSNVLNVCVQAAAAELQLVGLREGLCAMGPAEPSTPPPEDPILEPTKKLLIPKVKVSSKPTKMVTAMPTTPKIGNFSCPTKESRAYLMAVVILHLDPNAI